jgi:hypothetical protein
MQRDTLQAGVVQCVVVHCSVTVMRRRGFRARLLRQA